MNSKAHAIPIELKREPAQIQDPEDKLLSECMFLVVSSLETGADVDRLTPTHRIIERIH